MYITTVAILPIFECSVYWREVHSHCCLPKLELGTLNMLSNKSSGDSYAQRSVRPLVQGTSDRRPPDELNYSFLFSGHCAKHSFSHFISFKFYLL